MPVVLSIIDFAVKGFEGTKSIVISTTSWIGGKNPFLGIAYVVVGSICILLGLAFLLKHHFSPRYDCWYMSALFNRIENWAIIRIYPGIKNMVVMGLTLDALIDIQ
jgi:hypothetical protein